VTINPARSSPIFFWGAWARSGAEGARGVAGKLAVPGVFRRGRDAREAGESSAIRVAVAHARALP